MLQQLAPNLWIVDGEAVQFLGLPYTTRMVIIRLNDDLLWIHSPIALSEQLRIQIEQLGVVTYLIAPNHLHHLFLPQWLSHYPSAELFGTDEVIQKRHDLIFQGSFNDDRQWPWYPTIEQRLFSGSPWMEECVFFHKPSATLIVTDLVENFDPGQFNWWQRPLAKITGILAPEGKTPIDWRVSFWFGKKQARSHLEQILAWQPKTLVMAHGIIITDNVELFLARSFCWLGEYPRNTTAS